MNSASVINVIPLLLLLAKGWLGGFHHTSETQLRGIHPDTPEITEKFM